MFQDEYRKAYDNILPDSDSIKKIMKKAGEKESRPRRRTVIRPILAAIGFLCVLSLAVVPVLAAHIPGVYRILERYSFAITDYIIPEENESVSQGIIMQLEAVNVEKNRANVIVSFRDETGENKIKGKVDMFDSYGIYSYDAVGNIGGCSFLEYDEAEGKAYFKVDMTAENDFDRNKLSFYTGELLTGLGSEERMVDLSGALTNAPLKTVTLSGSGGVMSSDDFKDFFVKGNEEDPRPGCLVLDAMDLAQCAKDDFTITGIAYMDDILRVQICMGDNTYADRHVQLFLTEGEGEKRHEDHSVSWQEMVEDAPLTFYEFWFVEASGEAGMESKQMYGIFHDTGESIEGNWKVTFRLE